MQMGSWVHSLIFLALCPKQYLLALQRKIKSLLSLSRHRSVDRENRMVE